MSFSALRRLCGGLALLALLQGCQLLPASDECCEVSGPVADPDAAWHIHQQQVTAIEHWQLDGKLGVRTAEESGSLRLNWQQQPEHYRIRATDPLGRQLALLEGNARGVLLAQGDQRLYAQSPEALLAAQLGWPLPVSDLLYWVRGLPAPGEPDLIGLNEMGQLDLLSQHGWQLTFDQYRSLGHFPPLPGRISATQPESGLKLKLIIYDWQLQ